MYRIYSAKLVGIVSG